MTAEDQTRQGWEYIRARYGDPTKWGGQLDWYDYPQDAKKPDPDNPLLRGVLDPGSARIPEYTEDDSDLIIDNEAEPVSELREALAQALAEDINDHGERWSIWTMADALLPVFRAFAHQRAAEELRSAADSLRDDVLAGLVSINVVRKIRARAAALTREATT